RRQVPQGGGLGRAPDVRQRDRGRGPARRRRADRDRDGAGRAGRPGVGCTQARHPGDRPRRAGAAVREHGGSHQGRHPLRGVHHPGRRVTLGGTRHEARERAMSLLYEAEMKGITPADLLDELPVPPDPFVVDLVQGVGAHHEHVDELIATDSVGWTLDRMPAVDRNVLRLAVYELTERPDIPTGAVISEAVELAKQYSTDESGRFVNGVLASVAAEVRPTT